jgi:rod shape determining protein RodA
MQRKKSLINDPDWITMLLYLALVVMGFFSIYAADYDGMSTKLIDFSRSSGKQVIWIGLSFLLAGLILIIDSKFYTTFAYMIYGAIMLLLVSVLIFGQTINGSKSWFAIGGFGIQPAEFAKFAAALAVAKYLSALGISMRDFSTKVICGIIVAIPMALVLLQGDAGSALVFTVFILVLYREGLPSEFLIFLVIFGLISVLALLINLYILIGLIIALGAFLVYTVRKSRMMMMLMVGGAIFASAYIFTVDYAINHLKAHQKDRINVLFGKKVDPKGVGYNVNQSKITIGSGGLLGKGFLQGTQTKGNFVPEQTTDFIFCTVGEEYGFVGSLVVLGCLFGLLVRVVFIAERQRSRFSRIYGYAVACILFFHIFVNVGMTISLFPVMGIPLPFFSYGGSSIMAFTTLLFILIKLDSERLAVLR